MKTSDFSLVIDVNFTKNKNEVISLAEDIQFMNLYFSSWSTYVQARPGELYGNIYGVDVVREFKEVDEETGLASYSGRVLINPAANDGMFGAPVWWQIQDYPIPTSTNPQVPGK